MSGAAVVQAASSLAEVFMQLLSEDRARTVPSRTVIAPLPTNDAMAARAEAQSRLRAIIRPTFSLPPVARPDEACERQAHQMAESATTSALPSPCSRNTSVATEGSQTRIPQLATGGIPLPQELAAFFEPRLQADYRRVRIHNDPSAARLAGALNARAFTIGTDIGFASGHYQPETTEGRLTIAHELAHVAQQQLGLASPSRIYRWGFSIHHELTDKRVRTVAAAIGFPVDDDSLFRLTQLVPLMDLQVSELWFNFVGMVLESQGDSSQPAPLQVVNGVKVQDRSKEQQNARVHRNLSEHYASNQTSAHKHGEGGLYRAKTQEQIKNAIESNKRFQYQFEEKAWNAAARRPKGRAEWAELRDWQLTVMQPLAAALHVAQDRGGHGEGLRGEGHDRKIFDPNFDPDSKTKNPAGYQDSDFNTLELLWRTAALLRLILAP